MTTIVLLHLVIVPASLQDQGKEMQRHFLRTFYIDNSRKMEGIQQLVNENLNPWLARNSIITSLSRPSMDQAPVRGSRELAPLIIFLQAMEFVPRGRCPIAAQSEMHGEIGIGRRSGKRN